MLAFARSRQAPCACDFIYAHSFVEIQTRLEFDDSIRRANSLLECMKTGKPMEDGLSHRLTQSECNRNQTNTKKYRKIRSFTSETITSCSPFAFFRIPKYNMWRVTLRNYDIPFFPTTSHYPWISYSRDSFYHAGDHSIGRIITFDRESITPA